MKKKYLLYIPNGLYTPEFEIMLSKAQILIDEKKDVEIVTLGGGGFNGEVYATSTNIFSQQTIDRACKYKRNLGFKRLKGKFKLTYTPILKNYRDKFLHLTFNNRININNTLFEDIDIAAAALSSYINLTRDANLEGLLVKRVVLDLLNTSLNLYYFFKEKINKNNNIFLFNGRNNEYRPLLRLAIKNKIKISLLEFSGDGESNKGIRQYNNKFAFDPQIMKNEVNRHWKKSTKENKCDYYFMYIKAGRVINDKASYVLKQNKNLLPDEWDDKKRNIVYFTSSEDEYNALGGVFDETIYKNQSESIKLIIKSLQKSKNKDINFWIRCHPNLKKVFWKYNTDIFKLHDPKNSVFVVNPASKVSSYKMLENCEKVIIYQSRTGIEATYWRKPTIILGRAIFDQLGGTYNPKNHKQVMNWILDKNLKPKSMLAAIKYASFWVEGGFSFKYMTGSMKYGYKFKGKAIKFNTLNNILYYLGKSLQYYFFNYFINFKFSFLKNKKI